MAHPKTSSDAPKILRIGIVQRDRIIEERLVRTPADVTVGQSTKNTFVVPASDALPRSFTLFVRRPDGYALRLTDGLAGRISFGDEVLEVSALRGSARSERWSDAEHVMLTDRSRGAVTLGDVRVLFQLVAPPPIQPRPQLPASVRSSVLRDLNGLFTGVVAASFVAHLAFMIYLRNIDLPRVVDVEELPFRTLTIVARPPIDVKKPDEPKATVATTEHRSAGEHKAAPAKAKEPAVTGQTAAERRAALQQQVSRLGVLHVLTGRGDSGSVLNDLLQNGGVFDEASFKDLAGVDIGGAVPSGLNRARGTGTGSIHGGSMLRPVGPSEVASGARAGEQAVHGVVKDTKPIDVDTDVLDPALLVKEIRARIRGITACYEAGLRRNHGLRGKIQLRFEVSQIGKVTSADIEEDTVKDDEVASCIKKRVLDWRLPAPMGRSAQFSYPFIFQAAE